MSSDVGSKVGELSPTEAQKLLRANPAARLVDVRTRAEWSFVGVPDVSETGQALICVEWASFPGMVPNAAFAAQVDEALGAATIGPFLFLCRSGARSLKAAQAFRDHMQAKGLAVECLNVAEGFEGDLDGRSHRGSVSGWKARGLPWQQT